MSLGPEGAPEINTAAFLVYGFRPDGVDRQAVTRLFGVDINLTLVITDPEAAERTVGPVAQSMARIAVLLAAVPGAQGVIVTDYAESDIILRFKDGQVTLNQDWSGCSPSRTCWPPSRSRERCEVCRGETDRDRRSVGGTAGRSPGGHGGGVPERRTR